MKRAKPSGPGMHEVILCIDPSIKACGAAVFNCGKLAYHVLVKAEKEHKKATEWVRAYSVYTQVKKLYKRFDADRIIIELPAHWANEGFAARESGNIQKLYFLCGLITSIGPYIHWHPHEWKGQMPKQVMRNRLWDYYDGRYGIDMAKIDHNVLDAIGIGHRYLYGKV